MLTHPGFVGTAPHMHLPARAAPSFHRLLRQPSGAGLSPPLKQQRLTAHEAGPECLRNHVPRPHPDKMITDQIRSTVYLIDPGVTDTSASGVRAALVRVVCAGPGAAVSDVSAVGSRVECAASCASWRCWILRCRVSAVVGLPTDHINGWRKPLTRVGFDGAEYGPDIRLRWPRPRE